MIRALALTLAIMLPAPGRTLADQVIIGGSTGGGSPGGANGQIQYNNSSAFGGVSTFSVGTGGILTNSAPGSSTGPAEALTGTYTASTTPDWYISPGNLGVSSFSASGTMLGINATSGYSGNLLDLQVSGASEFKVSASGAVTAGNIISGYTFNATSANSIYQTSGHLLVGAKPSISATSWAGSTGPTPTGASSLAFTFTVGASSSAAAATFTFGTALNGWNCHMEDQSGAATTTIVQTGGSSTTAVMTAYTAGSSTLIGLTSGHVISAICAGV